MQVFFIILPINSDVICDADCPVAVPRVCLVRNLELEDVLRKTKEAEAAPSGVLKVVRYEDSASSLTLQYLLRALSLLNSFASVNFGVIASRVGIG